MFSVHGHHHYAPAGSHQATHGRKHAPPVVGLEQVDEIAHADYVEGGVRERQGSGISNHQLKWGSESGRTRDHQTRPVDSDHRAWTGVATGQLAEHSACSGSDIQHPLTAPHVAQLERHLQSIMLEWD